jgi:hypothetical protein
MKKYLLPCLLLLGLASSVAFAQDRRAGQDQSRFQQELNERDFEALREFLKTKRMEDLKSKAKDFTISGDVRTEWRHLTEVRRGIALRGNEHFTTAGLQPREIRHRRDFDGVPISKNDFDIEFNLRIDYATERTWAVAHVEYDNSAGVDGNRLGCRKDPRGYHGSGDCEGLCLRKAYFGYNLYRCGKTTFDIEIGRRNLYNVFDSRIQFLSRFDGLLFKLKSCCPNLGEWYWYLGALVVDERVNHFAYVTEIGFLNMYDSGVDFKYSFIDWEKRGINRCFRHNPDGFKFLNSQFTLYYHFKAELVDQEGIVFGAYLINHDGHWRRFFKEHHEHHARNQNKGWYVGFLLGDVQKEGDWSVEVRYEYVQAFAMPDEDASGICNGNVLNTSITQRGNAGGNTNYKGWRFEGLYALTDNITLDTQIEWSHVVDPSITGKHDYSKFELEAIYAF